MPKTKQKHHVDFDNIIQIPGLLVPLFLEMRTREFLKGTHNTIPVQSRNPSNMRSRQQLYY